MHTIDIKINKDYNGYYAGQVVSVPCDQDKVPLDQFWRRRLKDSKIDNSCEVVSKPRRPYNKRRSKKLPQELK